MSWVVNPSGAGGGGGGVTQTPGTSGHPSLLAAANPQALVGSAAMVALQARGVRMRAGRAGTLTHLYAAVNAASGNIDVGVYSAAQPRAQLWHSGSIVCPAGVGWALVGTPNIALTEGQEVDVALQPDNAVATFFRYTLTNTALALLPQPTMLDAAGQAFVMWQVTLGSLGLPATLDDTTFSATAATVAMIGRIT